MHIFRYGAGLLALTFAFTGCGSGSTSSQEAPLETEDQIASYGIGLNVGRSLRAAEGRLQKDAFLRGVEDAMAGRDPALEQEEIQTALQAFSASVQESEQRRRSEAGEANRQEGDAYLEENAGKEGVSTTASGLQYEVLEEGEGPTPEPGDRVTVHYRGTLLDGSEFDTTYDGEPATFEVGGGVIDGFSEALQLMEVGSRYRLVLPPDLAYGEQGSGPIEPNSTLIFEVELLAIE